VYGVIHFEFCGDGGYLGGVVLWKRYYKESCLVSIQLFLIISDLIFKIVF